MAAGKEASEKEKRFPRLEALLELRQRYRALRSEEDSTKVAPGTMRVLLLLGAPGLLALIFYACTEDALSMSLMTAAASFAVGALLGFLFGIPRTIANQQAVAPIDGQAGGASTDQGAPTFAPNTNLEQISDWLTKILVGVGLVQLGEIGSGINQIADDLQPGLGTNGHAAAVALMISFSITGFLSAYIFTRVRLQRAFTLAALFKAVQEKTDADTNAMALVRNQLDPGGDGAIPVLALAEALKAASPGTRAQAFFLAREQRRRNWRGGDKGLVNLVIPIFEALIAVDKEDRYHRIHGELGYALKDKEGATTADYERARESFSKAIEIRGPGGASAFPMFEFNRAVCNILLDPAHGKPEASTPQLAAAIYADLKAAEATAAGLTASKDNRVRTWKEHNPVAGSG